MRPSSKSISLSDLDKGNRISAPVLAKAGTRKAVFIDRDGTINIERGYIIDPQEIELVSTAGASICALNRQGIPVIVITNQAAIGKGLLTTETFEQINEKLWNDLQAFQTHYNALYYCPHNPEMTADCPCRKPKPGLLLQAAQDFNVDLTASYMIGDKAADVAAGHLSGCKTVLLQTRYTSKQDRVLSNDFTPPPDFICDTLAESVEWILPQILNSNGK